jgi:catechol 2,3-dioxygenase
MAVKELGHLVLYVRNLERSASFYRDVLGWRQVVGEGSGIETPIPFPIAMFSSGRTHHELLLIEVGEDAPGPPQGRHVGLYHFGLKVGDSDEDLRAALEQVRAAGAHVVGASDHTITHSLYINDPDGNEIELYVDVEGADWRDPKQLLAEIKPLRL